MSYTAESTEKGTLVWGERIEKNYKGMEGFWLVTSNPYGTTAIRVKEETVKQR